MSDPNRKQDSASIYDQLGASASKDGIHEAINAAGLTDTHGLFARVNSDLANDDNFLSVVHCDGAGTKAITAYLAFRATGDPTWFAGLARDALVMNLDDVFCLGQPQSMLLANAIARNAKLIPDTVIAELITSYREAVDELKRYGVTIDLSGGETADMGDVVRTLVVDATLVARIARANLIRPQHIVAGDVIVGLASDGQAVWEKRSNSGIGSNGLTLARHALLHASYRDTYPETCEPSTSRELAYRGPFKVSDTPAELSGMSVAEALLSPTRSFAPVLSELFRSFLPGEIPAKLHAIIHVTGGGLTKVSRFGPSDLCYFKESPLPVPPIFSLIQRHGSVSWREMFQVFNMGQRLELYLPAAEANRVIDLAGKFNIRGQVIGKVIKREPGLPRVRVCHQTATFDY